MQGSSSKARSRFRAARPGLRTAEGHFLTKSRFLTNRTWFFSSTLHGLLTLTGSADVITRKPGHSGRPPWSLRRQPSVATWNELLEHRGNFQDCLDPCSLNVPPA